MKDQTHSLMERKDLICLRCAHYTPLEGGCKAFPFDAGGIPEKILQTNRHDKPLPEQKNDLVFMTKGQAPAGAGGIG